MKDNVDTILQQKQVTVNDLDNYAQRLREQYKPYFENLTLKIKREGTAELTERGSVPCSLEIHTVPRNSHPQFSVFLGTSSKANATMSVGNLLGRAESLNIIAETSSMEKKWTFSFNAPTVKFLKNTSFGTGIYKDTSIVTEKDHYSEVTKGITASLSKDSHSLNYDLKHIDVSLTKDISEATLNEGGSHIKSSLTYQFTSKIQFLSTKSKVIVEYAGLGGDAKYLKPIINIKSLLFSLGKWKLKLFTKLGGIFSLGTRTFISDRFFLGGLRSFRGFEEKGVGPRGKRDPYGGNLFYHFTLLLQYPLFSKFNGQLFLEMGDLINNEISWLRRPTLDKNLFDQMRITSGVGISFKINNMMNFSLYYCLPIRTQPTDLLRSWEWGVTTDI
uniref:Bacterial surface antigen (D15) domain-containing protein n=1 Tax=Arcella intermedia TaxID=1963864 RepID=A0A6B2L670_9EUKA